MEIKNKEDSKATVFSTRNISYLDVNGLCWYLFKDKQENEWSVPSYRKMELVKPKILDYLHENCILMCNSKVLDANKKNITDRESTYMEAILHGDDVESGIHVFMFDKFEKKELKSPVLIKVWEDGRGVGCGAASFDVDSLDMVVNFLHKKYKAERDFSKNTFFGILTNNGESISVTELPIDDKFSKNLDVKLNYGKGFEAHHKGIVKKLEENSNGLFILHGSAGTGKCLGKGTKVLMFDGTIKNVEDIKNGEFVMGPDSSSRTVSGCIMGKEKLYKIIPTKGESYIVNESHILSLKKSGRKYNGEITNISVKDYLKLPKSTQRRLLGWRTGIEFNKSNVPIDPYFLGIWLGDGNSDHPTITTADKEVVSFLKQFAKQYEKNDIYLVKETKSGKSWNYRFYGKRGRMIGGDYPTNYLKDILKNLNLIYNKHIPNCYKINDKDTRLKLLAGLIDSDGHYDGSGFQITSKYETLIDDICYLARSLGFAAYKKKKIKGCMYKNEYKEGTYWDVYISGDCSVIPTLIQRKKGKVRKQIKRVLVTGIKIKELNVGEYYGFKVNKDGLFCLGDFTVTHNTTYIKYLAKVFGGKRKFIFIPTTFIDALTSPNIIPVLLEHPNSILVLEDAEKAVRSREENHGNESLVSSLLNIGDGILGSMLNLSIILTFNTSRDNIDAALLRKGRLHYEHEFGKLSIDDAQAIIDSTKKNYKVTEPMSLAEIYNVDVDNNHKVKETAKMGFAP